MTAMESAGGEILDAVCTLLEDYNPEGIQIGSTTDLNADLNIDSVAAMDIIMHIEDKFEIDIPLNLVSDVRRVEDLVNIVRKSTEKA
jgi:acyl carrier protein